MGHPLALISRGSSGAERGLHEVKLLRILSENLSREEDMMIAPKAMIR
jgi:hypothetical protein